MNYAKHYNLLIERSQNRKLTTYTEIHHIIPECIGGPNITSNRVRLTPEEHFLAHQLLIKIYPKDYSLIYAAKRMTDRSPNQKRKITNKLFGWLRRKVSKDLKRRHLEGLMPYSKEPKSEAQKQLLSVQRRGKRLIQSCKLNESIVAQIRKDFKNKIYIQGQEKVNQRGRNGMLIKYKTLFCNAYALKYNVTDANIRRIVDNETWQSNVKTTNTFL